MFLLLLTLVLALVGIVVTVKLRSILDNQSDQELRDELSTMRVYVHLEDGKVEWFADRTDPEDDATVGKLKQLYIFADDQGNVKDATSNPVFEALVRKDVIKADVAVLRNSTEPTNIREVKGSDNLPYAIISTLRIDDKHHEWYEAVGHSLAADQALQRKFRRYYFLFMPIALAICTAVSWYGAGNALKALSAVEKAAQQITGTNLGLQIPKRHADDELDRLIGSFNEMSRRLKASFDQVRQFSTDVSHELRTPLTAIQGQLEVALFTSAKPEQLREAIENALQDVERLANLVRALLLLSQSESGQIPMHRSLIDLDELVRDFVEQFQIPAEAQQLTLGQSSTGPVWCEIDRTQIERVITNLLSNALKYTPPGGWIRAHAEPAGHDALLVVEDSGMGIPQDHLPHIFDRFYRVPDPNPEKGLGLGLSFVASIVKAHGGEISVESEIGKGSRFTVRLPAGPVRTVVEPVVQLQS